MAERSYILDTNILVYLLRGNATGKHIAEYFGLFDSSVDVSISIVSVGEIYSLARQWKWGMKRFEAMRGLLNELRTLDIERKSILREYGFLDCLSRKSGRTMGKNDVWIAATAKTQAVVLLTTDKDFDHLHPEFIERVLIDGESGDVVVSPYGES